MKPLAIELFCGSFGWSAGWLELGGRAIGFDIEHLPHHGPLPENAKLVLQDVTTLHGSQFKDASIIFASPPCQNYSYLAMPWSRSKSDNSQAAKALRRKWETEGPDNRLFDACFRIQREASEAAGRYIPLIVENVRGAQPWVGRSAWNYGSFHLWGDVPALMPINLTRRMKSRINCGPRLFSDRIAETPEEAHALHYRLPDGQKRNPDGTGRPQGSWFRVADSSQGDRGKAECQSTNVFTSSPNGGSPQPDQIADSPAKRSMNLPKRSSATARRLSRTMTTTDDALPGTNADGSHPQSGLKIGGDWFRDPACHSKHGSRSSARKAASAQIARIPFELSSHIAKVYFPR